MLDDIPQSEVDLLRIALLNRTARLARMSRELENAQLHANGLHDWVLRLMKENASLRRQLGKVSLDPPHLPTRFPDNALAKTLGNTRHKKALK